MDTSTSTSEEQIKDESKEIMDLVNLSQWLDNQILEYQATINAAQVQTSPESEDVETYITRLSKLQQQLLKANEDHSLAQLMLHRYSMSKTLEACLFPSQRENGDDARTADSALICTIKRLSEEQRTLVSKVMKLHKEMNAIKPELEEVKKQNREMMRAILKTREDMKSQKKPEDQHVPDAVQRSQEKLSERLSQLEMTRNVFQGIIIGSGINWGADPEFSKLVLSLGQPLTELEKHGPTL